MIEVRASGVPLVIEARKRRERRVGGEEAGRHRADHDFSVRCFSERRSRRLFQTPSP
ncbi:Hypothetical protein A7982_03160 [Minicystis rosea]|nr:Hypothetical protein A7982_03160 [Minicystis rosea]